MEHGVKVRRSRRPDAVAYCAEPDTINSFTIEDLRQAAEELPEAGMVIVTRRLIEPDVHEQARCLEICVDTFAGFTRAIDDFDDISKYIHPEESYIRKRMLTTRAVTSVTRRGHRAWEITRVDQLRPLTVVTHDRYELTDDDLAEVVGRYPKLHLDALVITNPNTRGFADRVANSARQAGLPLYTLDDFIREIRKPWI